MATHAHEAAASISILNRDIIEASSTKHVFGTVGTTLALVREKITDDNDSVQLSEYCSNVREILKTTVQGRNGDSLDESVRAALEGLGRVTEEIERTLRRGANTPRTERNKEKVKGQKFKIQKIPSTRSAPSAPVDPIDSHAIATISTPESACGRLARRTFAPHELPSLMEVIFSSQDEGDTIRRLLGDDEQAFVDVVDEALDRPNISSRTRESCLKALYKICGRRALLPTSLKVPISFEQTGNALFRGGFADVWKGEHCGRDVAVKVIRIYSDSDLQRVIGRFCKEVVTWKTLRHPNVLHLIGVTMSEGRFAMISDWMANGNINRFVMAHPDANRLKLLSDVTSGLIYIHGQGMIHGDLKGANILIDRTGHARLADFGLLTIISDPKYLLSSSSHTQGGTVRWMSPERIAPERFGFENSRPTLLSDCYALGMVIYETITGHVPFHKDTDLSVSMKVVKGKRPPRGTKFADDLWRMVERCWASRPNTRPSIGDVLLCLEMAPNLSEPHSPMADEGTDEGSSDWDSLASSSDGGSSDFHMTDDIVQLPPVDSLQNHHPTDPRHASPEALPPTNPSRPAYRTVQQPVFSHPPPVGLPPDPATQPPHPYWGKSGSADTQYVPTPPTSDLTDSRRLPLPPGPAPIRPLPTPHQHTGGSGGPSIPDWEPSDYQGTNGIPLGWFSGSPYLNLQPDFTPYQLPGSYHPPPAGLPAGRPPTPDARILPNGLSADWIGSASGWNPNSRPLSPSLVTHPTKGSQEKGH